MDFCFKEEEEAIKWKKYLEKLYSKKKKETKKNRIFLPINRFSKIEEDRKKKITGEEEDERGEEEEYPYFDLPKKKLKDKKKNSTNTETAYFEDQFEQVEEKFQKKEPRKSRRGEEKRREGGEERRRVEWNEYSEKTEKGEKTDPIQEILENQLFLKKALSSLEKRFEILKDLSEESDFLSKESNSLQKDLYLLKEKFLILTNRLKKGNSSPQHSSPPTTSQSYFPSSNPHHSSLKDSFSSRPQLSSRHSHHPNPPHQKEEALLKRHSYHISSRNANKERIEPFSYDHFEVQQQENLDKIICQTTQNLFLLSEEESEDSSSSSQELENNHLQNGHSSVKIKSNKILPKDNRSEELSQDDQKTSEEEGSSRDSENSGEVFSTIMVKDPSGLRKNKSFEIPTEKFQRVIKNNKEGGINILKNMFAQEN